MNLQEEALTNLISMEIDFTIIQMTMIIYIGMILITLLITMVVID